MAAEVRMDSKRRIVIRGTVRMRVGLKSGSMLKVRVERDTVVTTKSVGPKEFIKGMEGFLKKSSLVQPSDPISLKEIWLRR